MDRADDCGRAADDSTLVRGKCLSYVSRDSRCELYGWLTNEFGGQSSLLSKGDSPNCPIMIVGTNRILIIPNGNL